MIVGVLVFVTFLSFDINAYMVGKNPFHRKENLDSTGKYQLEWEVDWGRKRVTFNVTCETKGYVGFGLSTNGKMGGADIVIGGVRSNGHIYFSDRHAVGNQLPIEDTKQDWVIHGAWESRTHTFLSFSRDFDTCDDEDYPITTDNIALLWAYGEKDDELTYHFQNRGARNLYLLDADYSPQIIRDEGTGEIRKVVGENASELKLWTIRKRERVPAAETSYFCSIHKGPRLDRKHHAVGFNIHFNTEQSEKITHHLGVTRCIAPRGSSAKTVFEPFIGQRQTCLSISQPTGPMPTHFCTDDFHGWAVGGKVHFTPPEAGYPMGASEDEYYLVWVHYNNPDERSDLVGDMRMEFFYTDKLRTHDAGMMVISHAVPGLTPSLLLPPSSIGHEIYGHCGPECTRFMFPTEGIRIFGTLLHSHDAGRQIQLHQFRGRRELPWVAADQNYAFNFQQTRNLREHIVVLPGDQLTSKCVFETTDRNGTVVGGYATRQEMCVVFIHYYNKLTDFVGCVSQINSETYRERFLGVGNITFDPSRLEFIANSPPHLAGLTMSEVSDNLVNWDIKKRNELQAFHKFHPHTFRCPKQLHGRDPAGVNEVVGQVGYPFDVKPFARKRMCKVG